MDEQRLTDALRGAVGDPPPPSFDHADVLRASRRITARRRTALAGGAMAVLVLAGVGVAAALPGQGDPVATPALAAPAPQAPEVAGGAAEQAAPGAADAAPPAGTPAAPGADARSAAAPLGPGDPATCANPQDPALRAIVEQVLPEVVGAPEAPTTRECRPGGERGVAVELGRGVLSVTYLPPGVVVDLAPGAVSAPTASAGTVVVAFSGPDGPGAVGLADAAAGLAPRL